MFRTFRHRLLFWFLVFISSGLVIIALSLTYINKREQIFHTTEAIEEAYLTLMKSVQSQQDYFSYDTRNPDYFETGESDELELYRYWLDSTMTTLSKVDFSEEFEIYRTFITQMRSIRWIDSTFMALTQKVLDRGFKDFSLEGAMRDDAHWLEQAREIPTERILTLRRHEKDFIIRNDIDYVNTFKREIAELETLISRNYNIPRARRDALVSRIQSYRDKFIELVVLEQELGIKDHTGYKRELDFRIDLLEAGFAQLVNLTREWGQTEFDNLTLYFGLTTILFVVISVLLSTFIAGKLTQPLTDLSSHITRFVDSDFTLEKEHPVVKSKDEVGSLTKNFSILKNEVISQMKFFKQRVAERTKELATANSKLAKLIKANSRFVPQEFLQNLGKDGIEEIELGDQVEREMTVVFTDIRGFTPISEALSPPEIFNFLNEYLSVIVPIIEKYGGFIDKFIGDSVMALFPNSPDDAIKAVMEFERPIELFNKKLQNRGMNKIHVGTGIHTGSMILGTIGHDNRLETTVISDAVNTAARVEGLTKYYDTPVIVTEETLQRLENHEDFDYRFLDKVKVKGKKNSLSVYQFLSPKEELKIASIPRYNEALSLFQEGKIIEAEEIFRSLAAKNPDDKASKRFIDRCADSLEGTSEGWGHITYMTKK